MSGRPTNDLPTPPQGTGRSELPSEKRGIVPGTAPQGGRQGLSLPAGIALCALGGMVATSTFSLLGPVFLAYGYLVVARGGDGKVRALGALAAVATAVVLSFSLGASAVVSSVVSCLVAIIACEALLAGRLTPGLGCVVVGAAAVCSIGADSIIASAQGTTIKETVMEALDVIESSLDGSTIAVGTVMSAIKAAMSVLWPFSYVLASFGSYLFATIGMGMATGRGTEEGPVVPRLVTYDLPLWVVGALVVSAAGLAVGITVEGALPHAVLVVSANLIMALRLAFAAQGLAVLVWLLDSKGLSPLVKGLVGALALYLEVQFVVMTIVGLVDVWANFRHLPRGAEAAADAGETA